MIAVVFFAFAETGTSVSTMSADGTVVERTVEHHTLLEHEGPSVLIVLAIPLALAAVGAAAALAGWPRSVAVSMAVLLAIFCILGAASVGLFFLPAAVGLVIAVARSRVRDDFVSL